MAEVAKASGVSMPIALPPGTYTVTLRRGQHTSQARVGLSQGARLVVGAFEQTPIEPADSKGDDQAPA